MDGSAGLLTPKRPWKETFRAVAQRDVAVMVALGLSAGLPLLLVFGTLSVWLTEAGVPRAEITFFSWAALAYAFKVVWAPLIDRVPLPILTRRLGRRRGWLLFAQCAIGLALCGMALTDPARTPVVMACWAVALGFASASQDVVIDAYRIEIASEDRQGLLSGAYTVGYRIGMLLAGAGALEIAGFLDDGAVGYAPGPWRVTYLVMACAMGFGLITTLLIREPDAPGDGGKAQTIYATSDYLRFVGLFLAAAAAFVAGFFLTGGLRDGLAAALAAGLGGPLAGFLAESARFLFALALAGLTGFAMVRAGFAPQALVRETYVTPFRDVLARFGRAALLLFAVIALYRIADVVMGVMANVFYVELGFEKEVIGRISKGFGLVMTLAGGVLGGLLALRYGVMAVMVLGAVLAAGTNLLFVLLAGMGPSLPMLMAAIAADNLSAGIAGTAFIAYLSALTSRRFTAVQYALFSSLMLLLPKLIAGYAGTAVDAIGYAGFFTGTALLGVPVVFLVLLAARYAPLASLSDRRHAG